MPPLSENYPERKTSALLHCALAVVTHSFISIISILHLLLVVVALETSKKVPWKMGKNQHRDRPRGTVKLFLFCVCCRKCRRIKGKALLRETLPCNDSCRTRAHKHTRNGKNSAKLFLSLFSLRLQITYHNFSTEKNRVESDLFLCLLNTCRKNRARWRPSWLSFSGHVPVQDRDF